LTMSPLPIRISATKRVWDNVHRGFKQDDTTLVNWAVNHSLDMEGAVL
jgi:hypothetical protein